MATHRLKLHLSKQITPTSTSVVATKRLSVRQRLLNWILGPMQQVTLVVPGKSVEGIDIIEREADLTALAEAAGVMATAPAGGDAA